MEIHDPDWIHGPEEEPEHQLFQEDIDYIEEEPDYDEAAWRWERNREGSMWDI